MSARRVIVWVVSAVIGLVCVWGIIAAFGTNIENFSISNTLLVFLAFGSLAFIWLDYFLKTNYLRA